MRLRAASIGRLVIPLKVLTQRFAFVVLISLSLGLIVIGKTNSHAVERFRTALVDVVAPALDVASSPLVYVSHLLRNVREISALHEENELLREANARLLQWQTVARRLEAENRSLRSLLRYVPDPLATFVTARVVGVTGGAFMRSVVVNAGARDGVRKGTPVVTGKGLVGRVIEVGERYARVLLLTDLNSRVPVVVETSRVPAIASGDNSASLHLKFLPAEGEVGVGERIVTSGHGGMFPPGMPIGVVESLEGGARVRPFVDWDRLEYVRIVNYRATGPLGAEVEEATPSTATP